MHVMCTYCQVCETTGQKLQRDKPEKYAPWLVKHADECDKNFTGNLLLLFYILFVTPSFTDLVLNTFVYILSIGK